MSALIDTLESVFPEDVRQNLRDLGAKECKGMSKPNLEELKDVTKACDPWLDSAVDQELKTVPGAGTCFTQSYNRGSVIGMNDENHMTSNYRGRY